MHFSLFSFLNILCFVASSFYVGKNISKQFPENKNLSDKNSFFSKLCDEMGMIVGPFLLSLESAISFFLLLLFYSYFEENNDQNVIFFNLFLLFSSIFVTFFQINVQKEEKRRKREENNNENRKNLNFEVENRNLNMFQEMKYSVRRGNYAFLKTICLLVIITVDFLF